MHELGFVLPESSNAGIVGWAKAVARQCLAARPIVAVPTRSCAVASYDSVGTAHERLSFVSKAVRPPLPTLRCRACSLTQMKIGPCFGSGPGGRPHSVASVSLANEGGRRADKAQCPDYSGRVSGLLRTDGRETSRPAPYGAPTRHLGLCAFDRGRTGPARSGRRGCPSTARGRGCVLHRSQVPLPLPTFKTPHECAPRRVDRDELHIE